MFGSRAGWLAVFATAACSSGSAPTGPSVLLVTVDTLRADGLGCYGYPLDVSPAVDRLAAEGVLFEDATAAWPKTRPSLAAILSGSWPRTTGMRHQEALRALPDDLTLLPESFQEAGYQTAGVVANYNVGRSFGFQQGFDHFVEAWLAGWAQEHGARPYENAAGRVKEYTDAGIVTDEALAFLEERDSQRPFFLWVHYMDPHGPYVPPAEYRDLFEGEHAPAPRPLAEIPEYQRLVENGEAVVDLGRYRRRYDQEIRDFDDQLGRLRGFLEREGLWDELVVAFVADHGESFGEHDYVLEHGKYAYQASARVPMILAAPGLPRNLRVDRPVSTIDLAPTILALAGLAAPASDGVSLEALARGGGGPSSPVVVEAGTYQDPTQLAVRDGSWKLVRARSRADQAGMGGEWLLFDLSNDPHEEHDRSSEQPARVQGMASALERWLAGVRQTHGTGQAVELGATESAILRDLGYVDSAVEERSGTEEEDE